MRRGPRPLSRWMGISVDPSDVALTLGSPLRCSHAVGTLFAAALYRPVRVGAVRHSVAVAFVFGVLAQGALWPVCPVPSACSDLPPSGDVRSEEHTSELQSLRHLV